MLYSERGRALIQALPPDRLLTETDGPFTQFESRPSRPNDVVQSIEILCRLLSVTPDAASEKIASNLRNLGSEA